jgi:hypothetical protein
MFFFNHSLTQVSHIKSSYPSRFGPNINQISSFSNYSAKNDYLLTNLELKEDTEVNGFQVNAFQNGRIILTVYFLILFK